MQLPAGLTLGIADAWLPKTDPYSQVVKAAHLATQKGAASDQLAKARDLFKAAAKQGAEIGDLVDVVDDKYEVDKGSE